MGFVFERLNEDQREALGFLRDYKQAKQMDHRMKIIGCYSIDREREAFLISLGGTLIEFELHWKGEVIYFSADRAAYLNPVVKGVENYVVTELAIPRSLKDQEQEVRQLMTEAVIEYGNGRIRESSHLKGQLRFLHDLDIRYPVKNKSKAKIVDWLKAENLN